MFAVAWRHNERTGWNFLPDPLASEQDAREKINTFGKYDMVRREYRIVPLGDADTWHDPLAEQIALKQPKMRCVTCGQSWDNDQCICGCGSKVMTRGKVAGE